MDRRVPADVTVPVAVVTVILLSAISIGVLVAARYAGRIGQAGPASGVRLASDTRVAMQSPTESLVPMPTGVLLSAPSTNVVWVRVGGVRLYLSTDQAKTWSRRQLPPHPGGGGPAQISFVDDKNGWMLFPGVPATQCDSAGVQVWRTTDGAATWQLVASVVDPDHPAPNGLRPDQCKENMSFVDPGHGFLMAHDPNHRPTIYRTSDGGSTWVASTLPDPPDFITLAGGFTLQADWVKRFGATLYLEAWGRQGPGSKYPDFPDRQYIFTSTDGGATWVWKQKVASRYIVMVTQSRWLQLVTPGQSFETTNGGQQFHPFASDFNTDTPVGGPQIVFADPLVGYAEGRGSLQRTTDGGLHWTRMSTPGTQQPG